MKLLIIYYSLTGNTKHIAEAIQEAIDADILELKPVKELDPDSSSKFMWGGAQSVMKKKPELEPFDIDPMDYDLIFIGTPVWAWRFSPPIRTIMSKFNLKSKKLALFMCAAGNGIKAMGRFKDALKGAEILGDICFKEPLKNNPEGAKEQAISWAKDIIQKSE